MLSKGVLDLKTKRCKDFEPWTQQQYEDAGCSGCYSFFLFTTGDVDCEKFHILGRRVSNSTKFDISDLVVLIRYGFSNVETSNKGDEFGP